MIGRYPIAAHPIAASPTATGAGRGFVLGETLIVPPFARASAPGDQRTTSPGAATAALHIGDRRDLSVR